MVLCTITKTIGVVKDQTSIRLVKVSTNMALELEVAIMKATSHDDDLVDENYVREILKLMSYSRGYVNANVAMVSKLVVKTWGLDHGTHDSDA